MTTGPWRPIGIDSYTSAVSDLRCAIQVKEDLSLQADITFDVRGQKDGIKATYRVIDPDEKKSLVEGEVTLADGRGKASFKSKVGEHKLWYPVGYGAQPLYTLEVTLKEDKEVSMTIDIRY